MCFAHKYGDVLLENPRPESTLGEHVNWNVSVGDLFSCNDPSLICMLSMYGYFVTCVL